MALTIRALQCSRTECQRGIDCGKYCAIAVENLARFMKEEEAQKLLRAASEPCEHDVTPDSFCRACYMNEPDDE